MIADQSDGMVIVETDGQIRGVSLPEAARFMAKQLPEQDIKQTESDNAAEARVYALLADAIDGGPTVESDEEEDQ